MKWTRVKDKDLIMWWFLNLHVVWTWGSAGAIWRSPITHPVTTIMTTSTASYSHSSGPPSSGSSLRTSHSSCDVSDILYYGVFGMWDKSSSPGIAAAMLSSSQLINFLSTTANVVTTMMPAPPMSFDNKCNNCNNCTTYSVDDNDLTTRRWPAWGGTGESCDRSPSWVEHELCRYVLYIYPPSFHPLPPLPFSSFQSALQNHSHSRLHHSLWVLHPLQKEINVLNEVRQDLPISHALIHPFLTSAQQAHLPLLFFSQMCWGTAWAPRYGLHGLRWWCSAEPVVLIWGPLVDDRIRLSSQSALTKATTQASACIWHRCLWHVVPWHAGVEITLIYHR